MRIFLKPGVIATGLSLLIPRAWTPSLSYRQLPLMRIRYFQVNAFTSDSFGGNPAGVCLLARWLALLCAQGWDSRGPRHRFGSRVTHPLLVASTGEVQSVRPSKFPRAAESYTVGCLGNA